MITSIFIFMGLVCIIIFLTYNRYIKQDDGWYLSWVLRWMQDTGNTNIKAYWDYTDTNDFDAGCSFVYTVFEGLYYNIFGIGVAATKALNAAEAMVLCSLLYLYLRKTNRLLGLLVIICLLGWNMFHTHFFNRPELPASIIALCILYFFAYRSFNRKYIFLAFFLMAVLLDLHPLSLFLVAGMTVKVFFKEKDKRWTAIGGGLAGMAFYFEGNYLVNGSFGIFSGIIQGIKVAPGDHYIPILATGWADMARIAAERFTFITKSATTGNVIKLLSFLTIFCTMIYLVFERRLFKNRLIVNSTITYCTFILLSTFLSEATSNGFKLYHSIAFAMFYFSLLYSIFKVAPVKYLAYIGLIPFIIFAKDALPQIKLNYQYHKSNKYYREFQAFNDQLPEHTKVLMRPTHAFFTWNKEIRFDYTYGLLRYMYKSQLSFRDAIIKKQYDYVVLDELFEQEFFTDIPSGIRNNPSPYYTPLKNTGLTGSEFRQLVNSQFLVPVDTLYDAFAGRTVLYRVTTNKQKS